MWNAVFFVNSILLGIGLAMDAFSVSVANALGEPGMRRRRMCAIAGTFAFFQAFMPMAGWLCVHTIIGFFGAAYKAVPWIAFALLAFIGGKMIRDGIRENGNEAVANTSAGVKLLLVQGIATSIDALSVGFTIAEYAWLPALVCALIIAAVTFAICMAGLFIGKAAGRHLSGKASIVGGVILICIGLEILITSIL